MRRGQKRTHFGRCAVTLGALAFAGALQGPRPVYAQSDAALEDQVLQGLSSPGASGAAEAPAASAPPVSAPPSEEPTASDAPTAGTAPRSDAEADRELRAARREQHEELADEIEEVDQAVKGPQSVPRDHVLVVQYRFIRKAGTHELTPIHLGIQPADSFRKQIGWGFGYAYHVTEDIGLEFLHATFYKNFETKLSDHIFKETSLITDRKEPVYSLASSVLWTPLKSKAAAFEDVWYFEGFFAAGGGFTKFEDRNAGLVSLGVGFRAYLTQTSLYKVEVRDSLDFLGGTPSHRLNAIVSASLLFGGSK